MWFSAPWMPTRFEYEPVSSAARDAEQDRLEVAVFLLPLDQRRPEQDHPVAVHGGEVGGADRRPDDEGRGEHEGDHRASQRSAPNAGPGPAGRTGRGRDCTLTGRGDPVEGRPRPAIRPCNQGSIHR